MKCRQCGHEYEETGIYESAAEEPFLKITGKFVCEQVYVWDTTTHIVELYICPKCNTVMAVRD